MARYIVSVTRPVTQRATTEIEIAGDTHTPEQIDAAILERFGPTGMNYELWDEISPTNRGRVQTSKVNKRVSIPPEPDEAAEFVILHPCLDQNFRPVIVYSSENTSFFGYTDDTTKDDVTLLSAIVVFDRPGITGMINTVTRLPVAGDNYTVIGTVCVKRVSMVIELEPAVVEAWRDYFAALVSAY